jgi:hypothetical protein
MQSRGFHGEVVWQTQHLAEQRKCPDKELKIRGNYDEERPEPEFAIR